MNEMEREAFKSWARLGSDPYDVTEIGRGVFHSGNTQNAWYGWQAAVARTPSPREQKLVEALNWARVMIKFHVKPERCVEIGDNVKSAIALYEDIQKALAYDAPGSQGGENTVRIEDLENDVQTQRAYAIHYHDLYVDAQAELEALQKAPIGEEEAVEIMVGEIRNEIMRNRVAGEPSKYKDAARYGFRALAKRLGWM